MALETGTFINSLVATNPVSGDTVAQGDDHLRLIKSTIKNTFPNLTAAVTATAAELNKLDGATASVTELNYVTGVTSAIQTQLNTKLASASYTAADVLAKLLTVDGAASGVDADLLDGQHGSFYQSASNLNAGTIAAARLPSASTTAVGAVELATTAEGTTGTDTTRVTPVAVVKSMIGTHSTKLVLGSSQALTGTAIDFTGIPSGVNAITISFTNLDFTGTNDLYIQLGDSGGIETTGYTSTSLYFTSGNAGSTFTAAFGVRVTGSPIHGHVHLFRVTGNTWVAGGFGSRDSASGGWGMGGSKTLSGTLDRLRLTRSGTDSFATGTVNITYHT